MRLNGAAINGSRLNVGPKLYPELLAADAVAVASAQVDATRIRPLEVNAPAVLSGQFQASAQRYFGGDLLAQAVSSITPSVARLGAGSAVLVGDGSLYYQRLIYGTGGGVISVIAISDVGVVYGEGSGVMTPFAQLTGARMRVGYGDAISIAQASLAASAIRRTGTADVDSTMPLLAALDTATILAGGIRRIDGTGEAVAFLELEDNGLKRQVLIGSIDLFLRADGLGSAIRNAWGAAQIETSSAFGMYSVRRAEGAGIIVGAASGEGQILVPGQGDAVIQLAAAMTGYVYRRGGVLDAMTTIAAELNGVRLKLGQASAPLVASISLNGLRAASGFGEAVLLIRAESDASDYNFTGVDEDDDIFYRPASTREFSRPASIREWRRQ